MADQPVPVADLEATMAELFRLFREHHVRDMTVLNLSPAQGFCLKVIGSVGPMTMGQLAEYLALSSAAVTSQVDRLETIGWVVREPDDKDRRVTRVRLTASGQAKFEELKAHRCQQLQQSIGTLNRDEQAALLYGLQLFTKALGRSLNEG